MERWTNAWPWRPCGCVRFALLLAIAICLAAGGCCLWSLWQFYGHAGQVRSPWLLLLGAFGLVESCLLAVVAVLLARHAGRLAGIDRSRQPLALEKSFTALRQFWLLAALALLLRGLPRCAAPGDDAKIRRAAAQTIARIWPR